MTDEEKKKSYYKKYTEVTDDDRRDVLDLLEEKRERSDYPGFVFDFDFDDLGEQAEEE